MLTDQHSQALNPKPERAPAPQLSVTRPSQRGTELALAKQPPACTQPPKLLPVSQTLGFPVVKGPSPGEPPVSAGLDHPRHPHPSERPLSRGEPALTPTHGGSFWGFSQGFKGWNWQRRLCITSNHAGSGRRGAYATGTLIKIPDTEERGDPAALWSRRDSDALGGAVIYLFLNPGT